MRNLIEEYGRYFILGVLFALVVMIASSCSPVKRFNRLITKHPELIRTDTIVRYDTVEVIVPEVVHDTSFHERLLHDTVTIEKERLKIRLWEVRDTVYVEGKCETDTVTVVREVEIPVKYYENDYKWWHKIPWWVYLSIILASGYSIYKRFKK